MAINNALKVQLGINIFGTGDNETYYCLPTAPYADPVSAIQQLGITPNIASALNAFIWARLQVLSPLASLTRVRVSTTDGTRTSAYADLGQVGISNAGVGTPPGWQGMYPAFDTPRGKILPEVSGAVETYSNLMCTWRSAAGGTPFAWHQQWLYSVPEVIVSSPQGYAPTATWNAAFGTFLVFATSFCQLRTRKGDGNTRPDITFLAVDASARFMVIQPVPVELAAAGQQSFIDLRGIKYPHKLNGRHKAIRVVNPAGVPAGTYLRVGPGKGTYRAFPLWEPNAGGSVQVTNDQFLAAASITPQRLSERKHGRPTDVPLGRQHPA